MLIETFSKDGKEKQFMLKDLPQGFNIEVGGRKTSFTLQAVICYKPGHFSVFCNRPNKTWIEYDDTKDKSQPRKNQHKVNPQILTYILK